MVARLDPRHYEARPLPREVAAYSSPLAPLRAGGVGKVSILDLAFAPVAGRTELLRRYQKSPLRISRPVYADPERPDMAVEVVGTGGAGMAQGDRFRIDVACEPGSALHLTTQGPTKVMRMDDDYATSVVNLTAGRDCLLEYLPDPIVPGAGSRSYHRTRVSVARGTTAFVGETIRAERLAHGERHAYDVLATDLEVHRPDGSPLVVDRVRLAPGGEESLGGPGVLGDEDELATLHVVCDITPPEDLAGTLREALDGEAAVRWGVSVLPGECGAWVRILGSSAAEVDRAMRDVWDAARRLLVGAPAPSLGQVKRHLT